ncbi:MAG: hypothetical protein JRD93_17205 [Deltaproteobacteria bacterium]|nr:hypothetical protein [Deltaproteobacteria bacterium]
MCYSEWLPEMVQVSPWCNGGNNDTYEMLYQIFSRDMKNHDLKYSGFDVWFFKEIEDGREKIFWHLTSRKQKARRVPRRKRRFYDEDEIPAERLPDLRRSERLPWVKALIENTGKNGISAWDYEEGNGSIKTYVWLKNCDFVVIMKKYPNNSRRLVTSFYVDREYKQRDFESKYDRRIQ